MLIHPSLADIQEKVKNQIRLSYEDGIALFRSPDLLGIGALANRVREEKNGNRAYFIHNRHLNPTNICQNRCKFCAFSKSPDEEGAYTLGLESIFKAASKQNGGDISEFHIVGGLHPDLSLQFYLEMLEGLKKRFPTVHIQACTAVEISYLAGISGLSVRETLMQLHGAGLDSIPGGGAEIFNPDTRSKICPEKISGDEWLQVMKTAHQMGLRSNATMLYGHVETPEDRVDHLIRLRELQDETGGFMAFIPLAFHPKNTGLKGVGPTTGQIDLRVLAIARLMLDNFSHMKAYWIMLGPKISQIALSFGADDIDGTVMEEKITHSAGAQTAEFTERETLVRLIREAGREPYERDTLYQRVRKV